MAVIVFSSLHRVRIGLFVLYQGGVRVELQSGDVTNSDMCCCGYSAMPAVFVLMALLAVISAGCVLAATQGGPSSPTEQLVNWQQLTEQLVNWHVDQLCAWPAVLCSMSALTFLLGNKGTHISNGNVTIGKTTPY